MMTPKKSRVKGTTPMELAQSAARLTPNMEDSISEAMLWIKQNPKKWEEMMKNGGNELFLRCLIQEARHKMGQEIEKENKISRKGVLTEEKVDRDAKRVVGRMMDLTGLMMQMVGNKYFGDCTKKDLLESSEKRKADGIGSVSKYLYHSYVAKGLKSNQLVRNRYTNDDLRELLHKANKEAKSRVEAA
jgi:hypothetical protein